jgi:hypothetical protein
VLYLNGTTKRRRIKGSLPTNLNTVYFLSNSNGTEITDQHPCRSSLPNTPNRHAARFAHISLYELFKYGFSIIIYTRMSTPSIKVGQGNWGIKAGNLLGYANTDKKFVAREFTVGRLLTLLHGSTQVGTLRVSTQTYLVLTTSEDKLVCLWSRVR